MSKSRKEKALDTILRAHADLARENHEIWSEIDQDRYTAVMDKKPEVRDGLEFLDNDIPIPPTIVDPFFPTGGLALMHGKRGLGKTMFSMGLVRSICTGEPFLGLFETRKGSVVYMQLDMTDNVFQDRLRKSGDFYRLEDFYVLTGVASVQRATENSKWVEQVNALQPDLIIIDTLRKAHSMNENDSDTPARFYNKLRELFGWTSVLLIHHDRKSSDSSSSFSGEDFRGSGAWIDDVDVGLHLKKVGRGLQLEFSKVRICEAIDPIPVQIDPQKLCLVASTAKNSPKSNTPLSSRNAARLFRQQNPGADVDQIYEHLLDLGFSKAVSSRMSRDVISKPI